MTLLNLSDVRAHEAPKLESSLVVAAVAVLSSLALADRMVAWLIGEFPSSAMLWQVRFELLRPVGVYYDFAVRSLGQLSPLGFCWMVLMAATLIAGSVLSRVRLLRALACHALCGIAVILWICSLEYREGIYAPAGAPSAFYALIGAVLALSAATLCLRIHAEYIGWDPSSSRLLRQSKIAWRRSQRRLDNAVSDLLGGLGAVPQPRQGALAPLRIKSRGRTDH